MRQIDRIFILFLILSKLDQDWYMYILIGFGPKWNIINISFNIVNHFNFFLKYDRDTSVLFTLKVSSGFIRRYKSYMQITFINFIILYLNKK